MKTQEWISVKDKLPEAKGSVLVFINGDKTLEEVNDGSGWGVRLGFIDDVGLCCNGYYKQTITHWMPLPEPPSHK